MNELERLRATLGELQALLGSVPVADLPEVIGALARIDAQARLRLTSAGIPRAVEADRLINARECAARLGLSIRWVYAHSPSLPFAKRLGRAVRFSSSGLERWQAARRA